MAVEIEIDHYAVLGLASGEEGAKLSNHEINKAYRSKALLLHPDKRRNDPNAHANFLKLQNSYLVLKDAKSRKLFDDLLRHRRIMSNEDVDASDLKEDEDEEEERYNYRRYYSHDDSDLEEEDRDYSTWRRRMMSDSDLEEDEDDDSDDSEEERYCSRRRRRRRMMSDDSDDSEEEERYSRRRRRF